MCRYSLERKTSFSASGQICPFGLSFSSLFQNRGKFAPTISPGSILLLARWQIAPIFWRTFFVGPQNCCATPISTALQSLFNCIAAPMMNPNQDNTPCTPSHGMGDMHQRKKPDPPGGVDFVCQAINAPFDRSGSMSTMTNPHGPNLSPPMISAHSTTNASFSQNTNSNNDDDDSNDNNEILTTNLISNSTNDPNDPRLSYLDQDDAVLLSIGFSNHSLVLNYIQQ
jgi:hypothetical protein